MGRNWLLQKEINKLKESFLLLGSKVEESVRRAVKSLRERDIELARQVIEGDVEIDQMEVDLEEECLKILALHQPVAVDLRLIVAVLKINNDLERVGDLAVSIAEHTLFLSWRPPIQIPFDYDTMAEKTHKMLKRSLDALVHWSASIASEVRRADDEVDAINRQMYKQVEEEIRRNPQQLESLINVIGLSRSFERIADLATNIAEDVIYLVEGEIVRHNKSSLAHPPDEVVLKDFSSD